jgi:hypothetical protein
MASDNRSRALQSEQQGWIDGPVTRWRCGPLADAEVGAPSRVRLECELHRERLLGLDPPPSHGLKLSTWLFDKRTERQDPNVHIRSRLRFDHPAAQPLKSIVRDNARNTST